MEYQKLYLKLKSAEYRHFILTIILAFLIPVHQNLLGITIVLLAVNSAFLKTEKKQNTLRYLFAGMFLYFGYHVAGTLWSENQSFAWFDVQIKLSFLLLPFIFMRSKSFCEEDFNKVLSSYIIGCSVAMVIGVLNAFYEYQIGSSTYLDFYAQKISPSLHIGYFSMYMNFAIIILIYKLYFTSKELFSVVNIIRISLILLFSVAIFFSTSRNGFLVLFFIFILAIVYSIVSRRKWMFGTLLVLISWIALSSFLRDYKNSTSDFHGFKQVVVAVEKKEVRKTEWESSAVRILVWKTAVEIIQEYPILGTGTGDIKDELVKLYKEKEYKYAYERRYNAHNQYLQTAAALGIPAGLILIFMIISPLFYSWKRWHFLGFFLAIIVGIACLTESVLEVQAGVVFYAFFASLFAQNMQNDYRTNFIDNPLLYRKNKI